jgi:hypothetical protein
MKKTGLLTEWRNQPFVAGMIGTFLWLAASQAYGLELGILNTWLKGGNGGLAYGGSVLARQEIWRYADVSGRVGYSKSDCHGVTSVPLELTGELKYPLHNDRWVPYVGMGVGYHIWTGGHVELENSMSWFPLGGLRWYPGKDKKWCVFIEGRYEYMDADIISGGPPGKTEASFMRWGGGVGVSYRF